MNKALIFGLMALLATFLPESVHAYRFGTVDQYNVGSEIYTGGHTAPFSFGQSFTPSLSAIDGMEFLLAGNNSLVTIRLRDSVSGDDGLGGSVIAESLPKLVNSSDKWYHFDFPARVSLTPGQTYVAELSYVMTDASPTGAIGVRTLVHDQYPGGQYFNLDYPSYGLTDADLIFREGLHIPEPATGAMLLGIALCASTCRRLPRSRN